MIRIGGLSRAELLASLARAGVRLNPAAVTLLDDAAFDDIESDDVRIVERTVAELGHADGASLSQIFAAAQGQGLLLCPPVTGPFLRLSRTDQEPAPDRVMSFGRAPTGSITVASPPLRLDAGYPRGFYLRNVDGTKWLRGYHCTNRHRWSAGDRFAFRCG